MSDNCPKCGANRTQFEGQTSWECGSYQSVIGGSHVHNPQFKLIEGAHCKDRQQLAALTQRAEQTEAWQNRAIDSAKEIATVECIDGVWWAKCRYGGLYGPQATEREVWLEAAEMRLTAAEAEVKRLREGIRKKGEELRTGTFCRMCEHMQDMCDCKEISAEYDALLAQPSDGKETTDE